jgi:protein SCO1
MAIALSAVLLALMAAACDRHAVGHTGAAPMADVAYHGVFQLPALEKPDVTLADTTGAPFDLRQRTQGKLTLVYLGYTHCPDICPTHMAQISAALKSLSPDVRQHVSVIFVTTDPARDTGPVLRRWLDNFDADFIGLVPRQSEVNDLASKLDMPPLLTELTSDGGYAVDHAAFVLAFTRDNLAHIIYPSDATSADWAADIPKLATDGWQGPRQ